jgi:hypothetical protein
VTSVFCAKSVLLSIVYFKWQEFFHEYEKFADLEVRGLARSRLQGVRERRNHVPGEPLDTTAWPTYYLSVS